MSKPFYFAVTQREPWQSSCDKCGATLAVPFYWTRRHSPYRVICQSCYTKIVLVARLAKSMNRPDPPDPRYE